MGNSTDVVFCLQGLAVAVSGDVYTAKAVIAARTPGAGGVGDGAGIMFAEGLYRNALRMIGTPRHPRRRRRHPPSPKVARLERISGSPPP